MHTLYLVEGVFGDDRPHGALCQWRIVRMLVIQLVLVKFVSGYTLGFEIAKLEILNLTTG